jgi:diguanylate cyclase (GGDEF)-like protein
MAGDAVLQMVAQVMQQRLRATDAIGRLGGDEFALVLRNCHYDDAVHYVEALRQKIAARKMNFLGRKFNIGVSAGITLLTNKTPSVTVALIEADRACYRAKSSGRAKRQLSPYKRLMTILRPRRKA